MEDKTSAQRIVVIERHSEWRDQSVSALRAAGFPVSAWDNYDYPPADQQEDQKPDLVILGCASIRHEERELISRILDANLHLLVFCISLPWATMRSVFLAGVHDVTDKPYKSTHLTELVTQAFDRMNALDSYRTVQSKGTK